MRASWARQARIAEVRQTARAWREANVIDAATLKAIEAAYPQPRPRLAAAWRVLIFFLVSMAINALFFGIAVVASGAVTALAIVFGVLLAVATEILRESPLAGNGSDAAASFSSILYLLAGPALLWLELDRSGEEPVITMVLALAAVLFGAACVHWGYAAYGGFAAASLFLLLGRAPAGRLWWVLAGAILIRAAHARLDRPYPPPIRRGVASVFAVSSVALYVAVNLYSLDRRWIEVLKGYEPAVSAPPTLRVLSSIATALLPMAFVAWGVRTRRTLVLDLGLLFTAASLVTLRAYVHLAPLWALLTLAGTALVLGALGLNRFLRRGSDGERNGFTAAPLYSGRRAETLQTTAVVAGFASTPAPARTSELEPGGGRFGGGGASGQY